MKAQRKDWGVIHSPVFQESVERNVATFSDLQAKIDRFIEIKCQDPLRNRYGKHDAPMTGRLKRFHHAHLRDDAIVIYTLKDRSVNLISVCTHAEIEGKRCHSTADRLSAFL